MKTKNFLSALFVAATFFMVTPCTAQCSWEATFVDAYSYPSYPPISTFVVGEHEYGDEIAVQITNTGSDTARGTFWYRLFVADENHQMEIENNYIDLSRMTDSGYLAPGDHIFYADLFNYEYYGSLGFELPFNVCFEIYDSATNETCHTSCLELVYCDGERVITITEDHKCQNQPYDFFGQPITEAGTYHHYDTTDNCILHYILHFTVSFYFPQPTITISGDTEFCEGGSTTLTAIADHSSYNGSPSFHLLWSNGVTTPSIHVTSEGVWSVTATYSYCTASKDVTISVLPNPEIQLLGDLQHCDGTPVELLLTTEEGAGIAWSDGTTGNQFTTEQSGSYTVTVTGENGCVSNSTFDVVSGLPSQSNVSMTAYYYFILNGIVYSQSGDYVCVIPNAVGCDSVINLHLTIYWPWDAIIYYDTACAGARYTQHNMDTVFVNTGDYAIALSATSALQLHVIECAPLILCSGEMSPCGNDSVTLTVNREAEAYHWNTGETTRSITVTQTGYYAVTITTGNGCELASNYIQVGHSDLLPNVPEICMTLTDFEDWNMITWNKNNANAVAYRIYRMTDNSGEYKAIDYYYPIEGLPDHWAYEWFDGSDLTNQHIYTYRISALDECGRESEWSIPISPMLLKISLIQSDTPMIHLEWSPYIGAEVSHYRIVHRSFERTTTELYYDIPYVFPYDALNGNFYIEAIIDHECSYREMVGSSIITFTQPHSNRVNFQPTQSIENHDIPMLSIFPNPASDVLNIRIGNLLTPSTTIEIYDLYGRLITQESCYEDLLQVNLSQYKSGVYIIRAFTENKVVGYGKFVKE